MPNLIVVFSGLLAVFIYLGIGFTVAKLFIKFRMGGIRYKDMCYQDQDFIPFLIIAWWVVIILYVYKQLSTLGSKLLNSIL